MLKKFKRSSIVLAALVCTAVFSANSQDVYFRTHAGKKPVHSWRDSTASPNQNARIKKNFSPEVNSPYVWVFFSKPISNELKGKLDSLHVSVLGTSGRQGNSIAYKLKIRDNQNDVLEMFKQNSSFVNTTTEVAEDKISPVIQSIIANKSPNDTLRYVVSFNSDLYKENIIKLCQQYTDSIIFENIPFPTKKIVLISKIINITQIASISEVNDITIYTPRIPTLVETRKLLQIDQIQQQIMTLQEPVYNFWLAGKSYTGEGVTVSNGESGTYKNLGLCEMNANGDTIVRFDDSMSTKYNSYWGFSSHGLVTASILGGNGWGSKSSPLNPSGIMNNFRGIAPKVKFKSYNADVNSRSFTADDGYYDGNNDADLSCHLTDSFDYYNNILIFAASNAGFRPHGCQQQGYYSLEQNSKNCIVVGATLNNEMVKADFSSMGPTRDGRIKPDIMAPGAGTLQRGTFSIEIESMSLVNNGVIKTWNCINGYPTFNDYNNVGPGGIGNPVYGNTFGFTTDPLDTYMYTEPLVPSIVADRNDTFVIRIKAIPRDIPTDSIKLGIMYKRPSDQYVKYAGDGNPQNTAMIQKTFPINGTMQTLILPLSGDPLTVNTAYGWFAGDTIERIRLDIDFPQKGMISMGSDETKSTYVPLGGLGGGTSASAPVVAGVAALMLQKYGEYLTKENAKNGTTLNIHKNPMWNSTVRGILIHTATDMINLSGTSYQMPNPDFEKGKSPNTTDIYTAGPDWATGWGMVNPVKALEYTDPKVKFFETTIDNGEIRTFNFTVPSQNKPSKVRVTLCWDDPATLGFNNPSTAYDKKLVNDLDLYLKNVTTGEIVRPWTIYQTDAMHGNVNTIPADGLDPITPDMIRNNPAKRGIDTLNNVEVVDIDNPAPGVWQIVVNGREMLIDQSPLPNKNQDTINQDVSLIFDITPDITTPYNLKAVPISKNQIDLSWKDKTSGVNRGFYIERATGSGAFSQIATVNSNVTTYSNTGLSQNVKYRYRVRVNTANGNSDYSNIDSTTTYTNIAQGKTVTVTTFQQGNTGANAVDGNATSTRWAASSSSMTNQALKVDLGGARPISDCEIVFEKAGTSGDCNDFKIQTAVDTNNWSTPVNLPANTNTAQTQSYKFTGTARYVKITITDAPGTYWASMYEFRVFGSSCPSQVTGLTSLEASENQLKLSWQPSYGATSYIVKMSTAQGGPYYTIASGLTTTSFTTKDLEPSINPYYFIVVAVNSSGASVNSAELEARSYASTPNAPTSLVPAPSTSFTGYTLFWKDNSNCEGGFEIERSDYGLTNWENIGVTSTNESSFDDVNINSQNIYAYRVRAINKSGFSAYSPVTATLARTPTISYNTLGNNMIILMWGCDGYNQTGYTVESSTDGTNFTVIQTGDMRTYYYLQLTPNKSYYYRVNSYNSAGKSNYSDTLSVHLYNPCYGNQSYGNGYIGTVFGLEPAYASGSEYCMATDGNINTYYDYAASDGGYTGLDLGTAKKIGKIRFYPRSGFAPRMNGGKFQGSNTSSESGFVDLYTIPTTPSTTWTTVSISNTTAYRWVRYIGPNGSNGNIAEMEFYAQSEYTYEAETSSPSASSVGFNPSTGDAQNSNSAFIQLSGTPAVGAWLQFSLANVPAGTYKITVSYKANNNRCIFQGSVDGSNLGGTCDEYSSGTVYQKQFVMGTKTLTAGNHTIKFAVTGKNASSSGYALTIDKIVLTQ